MIVVVGSINLDLIGEVERLPSPGETVAGSTFHTAPGGKGANQALAAARAGAQVRMVGAVGRDAFAAEALALLADCDVDLSAVGRSHAATGIALILVQEGGENVIAVIPGANAAVLPGDIGKAALRAGDVLLTQFEIPVQTTKAALAAAREAGAVGILNTAPYRAEAVPLLAMADYVVCNETEFDLCAAALDLPGATREERMAAFARRSGRIPVVTLGADGVRAVIEGRLVAVPAMKVDPVDTVGAGDTFCGYFAAALAAGLAAEDALRRAVAAASLACTRAGAQPAIPLAAEVDAALKGRA